jgi:large subunit ribosomal protein L29
MPVNAHITELRTLNDAELVTRLAETRQELFTLRFQNATGQLDDNSRLSQLRKDIARINTLLRQREIEAHESLQGSTHG